MSNFVIWSRQTKGSDVNPFTTVAGEQMPEPVGIISTTLSLLQKSKDLLTGVDKKILLTIAATVAVIAIAIGGYLLTSGGAPSVIHPPQSTQTSATHPPQPTQTKGGLDLSRYCASYGYSKNDDKFCSSDIDLDKACSWQYEDSHLKAKLDSGPYSARCYTPQGKDLGGIANLPGYCANSFKGSTDVQASVAGKQWMCRTKINQSLACNWQYQKEGLQALKDNGIWYCYGSGNSKH